MAAVWIRIWCGRPVKISTCVCWGWGRWWVGGVVGGGRWSAGSRGAARVSQRCLSNWLYAQFKLVQYLLMRKSTTEDKYSEVLAMHSTQLCSQAIVLFQVCNYM